MWVNQHVTLTPSLWDWPDSACQAQPAVASRWDWFWFSLHHFLTHSRGQSRKSWVSILGVFAYTVLSRFRLMTGVFHATQASVHSEHCKDVIKSYCAWWAIITKWYSLRKYDENCFITLPQHPPHPTPPPHSSHFTFAFWGRKICAFDIVCAINGDVFRVS